MEYLVTAGMIKHNRCNVCFVSIEAGDKFRSGRAIQPNVRGRSDQNILAVGGQQGNATPPRTSTADHDFWCEVRVVSGCVRQEERLRSTMIAAVITTISKRQL